MHGLIITNQELGHNEYKIRRLLEECSNFSMTLEVLTNRGDLAALIDNEVKLNVPSHDFVIYLDKDIYLARMLEKAGSRLFNKADFIKLCDDKMLTNIACASLGIRMPKTFSSPLIYNRYLKESNYDFLTNVGNELGYPYIFKRVYGSLGEGVHLVNSLQEAKELYAMYFKEPLQFQENISSSFGKSMRVIVIDQEVVGSFIRYNTNDFRSNFGDTASSKKNENYPEFFKVAEILGKKLNIEYAGIDFLFDKEDKPVLCEINSNAFFEEFEKVTNINVAYRFLDMINKKVNKHE